LFRIADLVDTTFLSAGADGDIKIWKLSEPSKIAPRPLRVLSLANAFASSSATQPNAALLPPSQPYALACWSLGKYVAVGTDDGLVVYVDVLSEKPIVLHAVRSAFDIGGLFFCI
jgi:WD40 repeat protein